MHAYGRCRQQRDLRVAHPAVVLCTQVAKDLGDSVQILKLDVDKNPSMSTRLQVGFGAGECLPLASRLLHRAGSCCRN